MEKLEQMTRLWVTLGDISLNRASVTGVYQSEEIAALHRNPDEQVALSLRCVAVGDRVVHWMGDDIVSGYRRMHCETAQ